MKNKISLTVILLVFCVMVALMPTADAQSSIVTEAGSTGFKPVTAQNLTIATATATIIGVMPPACRTITVIANGATMYYGDANVTTDGLYPSITTGNSVTFTDISTRNPTIYFRALATATAKIGIIAR
jgi:hypothetical protein